MSSILVHKCLYKNYLHIVRFAKVELLTKKTPQIGWRKVCQTFYLCLIQMVFRDNTESSCFRAQLEGLQPISRTVWVKKKKGSNLIQSLRMDQLCSGHVGLPICFVKLISSLSWPMSSIKYWISNKILKKLVWLINLDVMKNMETEF